MDCTLEYDLQDGDKVFGSHCKCFECEPIEGYDSKGNKIELYSKDWWDYYTGVKKK